MRAPPLWAPGAAGSQGRQGRRASESRLAHYAARRLSTPPAPCEPLRHPPSDRHHQPGGTGEIAGDGPARAEHAGRDGRVSAFAFEAGAREQRTHRTRGHHPLRPRPRHARRVPALSAARRRHRPPPRPRSPHQCHRRVARAVLGLARGLVLQAKRRVRIGCARARARNPNAHSPRPPARPPRPPRPRPRPGTDLFLMLCSSKVGGTSSTGCHVLTTKWPKRLSVFSNLRARWLLSCWIQLETLCSSSSGRWYRLRRRTDARLAIASTKRQRFRRSRSRFN